MGEGCERCLQRLTAHFNRPSVNPHLFFVLAPCVKLVAYLEADYLKWNMFGLSLKSQMKVTQGSSSYLCLQVSCILYKIR